ncbi:hypothetical protein FACS189460_0970 [Deltaproteobacteria bacterium]|nr:hypothetical protein FACS189460_0970 [Deltaproteobacteria bacterium]
MSHAIGYANGYEKEPLESVNSKSGNCNTDEAEASQFDSSAETASGMPPTDQAQNFQAKGNGSKPKKARISSEAIKKERAETIAMYLEKGWCHPLEISHCLKIPMNRVNAYLMYAHKKREITLKQEPEYETCLLRGLIKLLMDNLKFKPDTLVKVEFRGEAATITPLES